MQVSVHLQSTPASISGDLQLCCTCDLQIKPLAALLHLTLVSTNGMVEDILTQNLHHAGIKIGSQISSRQVAEVMLEWMHESIIVVRNAECTSAPYARIIALANLSPPIAYQRITSLLCGPDLPAFNISRFNNSALPFSLRVGCFSTTRIHQPTSSLNVRTAELCCVVFAAKTVSTDLIHNDVFARQLSPPVVSNLVCESATHSSGGEKFDGDRVSSFCLPVT